MRIKKGSGFIDKEFNKPKNFQALGTLIKLKPFNHEDKIEIDETKLTEFKPKEEIDVNNLYLDEFKKEDNDINNIDNKNLSEFKSDPLETTLDETKLDEFKVVQEYDEKGNFKGGN